jgi:hypothetical protein
MLSVRDESRTFILLVKVNQITFTNKINNKKGCNLYK